MTSKPLTRADLVLTHDSQISAGDAQERYRDKIARIALDSMVEFVGLLDAKGLVLEINRAALDAVGIELSDVEGKPFWTTPWWQVSEEINRTLRESIQHASQGEFVRWDTTIFGRARGKETIIIDASLTPVKDEHGKVPSSRLKGGTSPTGRRTSARLRASAKKPAACMTQYCPIHRISPTSST